MKHCLIRFGPFVVFLFASVASAAEPTAGPLDKVRAEWKKAGYRFTPAVEAAFLDHARATALKKLADANTKLPADFLAWIDSDPAVKTTVYGARQDPAGILLILRSLEIDLGTDAVRKKYPQLALAMAVANAREGARADLSPRPRLVLSIPGDRREKVDTHAKDRPLDLHDHVINFLIDHAPIEEDVVVGHKDVPQAKGKPKREPIVEKRKRSLRAADVFASAELEYEFNEYLKAHGQSVQIHCGDGTRLNWRSSTLQGVDTKGVKQAFDLFDAAYKAKGYEPKERDPAPSLAERCAFLIRNNEHAIVEKKIAWPKFPINAPWPVLTLLAKDGQPLREKQDIWERYRDRGEFHGYGEYVGSIAQNGLMLHARRLEPNAFPAGSVQMMLHDGGVCGVMANISVRSQLSLGVPASTAGQPGHCALIHFAYNPGNNTYACQGGQYVTAGDAGTNPHVPWLFGDVDSPRKMVYHQSVAWSVNFGFRQYLDSMVAHTFFKQLPDADRKAHGPELLRNAIGLCPYNFVLAEDAIDTAVAPDDLIAFLAAFKPALASGKAGCPSEGLYVETAKERLFGRLAAIPSPADASQARAILGILTTEHCRNQTTIAAYKVAANSLSEFLQETDAAFEAHLASARNAAEAAVMADQLGVTAGKIADKQRRQAWVAARWDEIQRKELYFGPKNHLTVDPSIAILAKLAGKKPRSEADQMQSVLDQLTSRLKIEIAGTRTPQSCQQLAGLISTAAGQIKDDAQKRRWADALAESIAGKERYETKVKNRPQTLRDPCADVIAQLTNRPQDGKSSAK